MLRTGKMRDLRRQVQALSQPAFGQRRVEAELLATARDHSWTLTPRNACSRLDMAPADGVRRVDAGQLCRLQGRDAQPGQGDAGVGRGCDPSSAVVLSVQSLALDAQALGGATDCLATPHTASATPLCSASAGSRRRWSSVQPTWTLGLAAYTSVLGFVGVSLSALWASVSGAGGPRTLRSSRALRPPRPRPSRRAGSTQQRSG